MPRDVALELWRALGAPDDFVDTIGAFYDKEQRCFSMGRVASPFFHSTSGFFQGCPFSMYIQGALGMILAYDIDKEVSLREPIRPPDLAYAPKPSMRRATRPSPKHVAQRKRFAVKALQVRGSRRTTRQHPPRIVQARRRRLTGKQSRDDAYSEHHRKAHTRRHQP